MAKTVMIVEDDPNIRETVTEYLKNSGFLTIDFEDGLLASEALEQEPIPHLFILDIMVPGMSGLELLHQIRASEIHQQTPVIMLTALGDEATQILSFDALADDYITKPFSPRIMVKRVEALLHRRQGSDPILSEQSITLDSDGYQVWDDGVEIPLTLREFEILRTLMKNTGKVYTRQELLNFAWGYDYFGDERIVDVHIKNLRKKFSSPIIRTVKGVGYQLHVRDDSV